MITRLNIDATDGGREEIGKERGRKEGEEWREEGREEGGRRKEGKKGEGREGRGERDRQRQLVCMCLHELFSQPDSHAMKRVTPMYT